MSQRNTFFLVARSPFKFRCPEEKKDGLSVKKECVRAMISILAEVPQIQASRSLKAIQFHNRLPKFDAVGGDSVPVE